MTLKNLLRILLNIVPTSDPQIDDTDLFFRDLFRARKVRARHQNYNVKNCVRKPPKQKLILIDHIPFV